ncbi:MAG: NADH:ubiquinone oxidoreductase subunit NDUFA12 [Alphaproteobacteria bacterium]|nr:NADH:ubiquinone oxidoreductase subunit NDUFA12 [Alphaproteobacteria bacterium]
MTTSITRIITLFNGKWVGQDSVGNHYYEQKRFPASGKRKRWVVYAKTNNAQSNDSYRDDSKRNDPSNVAPNWHRWLHYGTDELPKSNDSTYRWEKAPQSNITGTSAALYPDSKLPGNETVIAGYQAWRPDINNKKLKGYS